MEPIRATHQCASIICRVSGGQPRRSYCLSHLLPHDRPHGASTRRIARDPKTFVRVVLPGCAGRAQSSLFLRWDRSLVPLSAPSRSTCACSVCQPRDRQFFRPVRCPLRITMGVLYSSMPSIATLDSAVVQGVGQRRIKGQFRGFRLDYHSHKSVLVSFERGCRLVRGARLSLNER